MKNRIQKEAERLAGSDAKFDKKIKALRPDWFRPQRDVGRACRPQ